MNLKNTWLLLLAAALLAGFIYGWEKFVAAPARRPTLVLPDFNPASVTTLQIRTSGQPDVLAERTNGAWRLVKPVSYPANSRSLDLLLAALSQVESTAFLPPDQLAARPDAESEFGFDKPQAAILFSSGSSRGQVLIGSFTAPGNQIYLQVVGVPGIHLVTTNLFNFIHSAHSLWRSQDLLEWQALQFDRIQVNQGTRIVELQRVGTNGVWRLARLQARADSRRVNDLLQQLRSTRISRFVSDQPGPDLDATGLQSPEFEMVFSAGTNVVAALQFGCADTNAPAGTPDSLYARRSGSDIIFTVPREPLSPWRAAQADFRDRHLVSFTVPPQGIEVEGRDRFSVDFHPGAGWRIMPQNLPADTNSVNDLLRNLAKMEVVQFVKDVVIEAALTNYGLASPPAQSPRQYLLKGGNGGTNDLRLFFGTAQDETVYARRTDENSVYAVRKLDFDRLPAASWELRDKTVWCFTEEDVTRVLIEQGLRRRELIRSGTNSWSLAPGSFGAINTFGVEEAVHRTGDLRATFWAARGEVDRGQFGFTDPPSRLTFTLKDGSCRTVEFGGIAPSQFPYAMVSLDGEPWVFEFPWTTWQYINSYLTIPVREF